MGNIKKLLLIAYIALLACNFLYIPWKPIDGQAWNTIEWRANFDEEYRSLVGNHWLWQRTRLMMSYATPAFSIIFLRLLTLLALLPLFLVDRRPRESEEDEEREMSSRTRRRRHRRVFISTQMGHA